MYYIACLVTWKYDTSLNIVTYVGETTDYGYDTIYYRVGSVKNDKGISSGYGIVQKGYGVATIFDYTNRKYHAYMIADFKLKAGGSYNKNVTTLSTQLYDRYTWGSF